MSKKKRTRKVVRKRTRSGTRRNAGSKRTRKRVRTKGWVRQRIKRPVIKKMKHAPRLLLEDRVGRIIFKIATRGADFKDTTVVKLRCTASFRLDACTAVSSEDKTWEAVLVGLKQNL